MTPRPFDFAVTWPRAMLGAIAVFVALVLLRAFGSGAGLAVDPSIRALLPRAGDELARFEDVRERFASDDLLLVTWLGDELCTPARLGAFKGLARRIESLPGVEQVDSLATAVRTEVHADYTVVEPYLASVPATAAAARALCAAARADALLAGYLVSRDGRGATIAVRFAQGLDARTLIARVAAITTASQEEAGGIEQFVSGPLFARLEISRLLLADLYRVMPLAVAATLVVVVLGFRSLRGVLLPLAANGVALAATLGAFVAGGHTLNYVTVILPPTVYVVGFAYAIHVVGDFDRHLARGLAREAAARAALAEVVMPLSLTAVTTATGFAALMSSPIEAIGVFGAHAAIGTLCAWLAALTVVPAGLVLLPAPRRVQRGEGDTRRVETLARLAERHGGRLVTAGTLFALLCLAALTRLEVGTDYLDNFAPDSRLRRDFDRLNEVFAGAVPLQVVVESRGAQADAFKSPRALRALDDLQNWLAAQPEVGGVYSLVDYVAELERVLAPELVDGDRVPADAATVNHLVLLGASEDIRRFTDAAFARSLLQVRVQRVASAELNALSDRIEQRLAALPPDLRGYVTGSSYLIARTLDDVTRGQVTSLAAALVPIFLVLAALFRSLRLALVALVPNVLPILAFFAALGLAGVTLNLTTSLVASAVLGIAVDDSIHFFARLRAAARDGLDEAAALRTALAAVLRPVTLTTLGLVLGFATLVSGELRSQADFGLLAAFTLAVAWALDLTLTPALACRAGVTRAVGRRTGR